MKIRKKSGGGSSWGGGGGGGGVRVDVNRAFVKIQKKNRGVRVDVNEEGGSGWGAGGQGGSERRIEVIVKMEKKVGGQGWKVEGWGVGRGGGACLVAMLGVGVMWGMGDVNQE